jgi:hypothetical protein
MFCFSTKAVKALVLIGVVGGVVVGCNDVASVKAPLPAEENTPVAGVAANRNGSAMLTADEREAKKREFFAKPEVKEMSSGLEEIAQAVAVAVEDKTLRDRIYAKCMEKFDGETNVLWQQLEADANLRSKGGWSKQVDDLVGKGRKNTTIKGIGNVDASIKKFEKVMNAPLHLFWAFPENWDRNTAPLVAFVPMDIDPDNREFLPSFDAKGNRIELDKKGILAKKRAVIVITFNERTSSDGQVKNNGSFAARSLVQRKELEHSLQSSGISGASRSIKLNSVTFPNGIQTGFENWWEGRPECIYTVQLGGSRDGNNSFWWPWTNHTLGAGSYTTSTTFTPSRTHSLIPSGDFGVGHDDFMYAVEFKFYEDDNIVGEYDFFDDWIGYNHWTATSSNGPGSPIITLPAPGTTHTPSDQILFGTMQANYTWQ